MIDIVKEDMGKYRSAGDNSLFSAIRDSGRELGSAVWKHNGLGLDGIVSQIDGFDRLINELGIGDGSNNSAVIRIDGSTRMVRTSLVTDDISIGDLAGKLHGLLADYMKNNALIFSYIQIIAPYGEIWLSSSDPNNKRDKSSLWKPDYGFLSVSSHLDVSEPLGRLVIGTIMKPENISEQQIGYALKDVYGGGSSQ